MWTGEVALRCLDAGRGPLVVLLHGFPDEPLSWRFQLPALVAAGFRVVAPALRGYDGSDRPHGVSAYRVHRIAADVVGLVRACGEERAVVVGHDWGGLVAWRLATRHPEVVRRVAILNAPHPARFARALGSPEQLVRSAYAFFFQLPWLPERVLGAHDLALVRWGVRRAVRREGAFGADDWARIHAALGEPGALEAALAYYRAAGRSMLRGAAATAHDVARVPALVLWGERDPALARWLLDGLERWAPGVRVRRFPRAGHWVHWDEPDRVRDALVAWCAEAGD